MSRVTHPPFPPGRRSVRATSWWARAFGRAIEEAAYGDAELRAGRSLARAGRVGGIAVDAGEAFAAVEDRQDVFTARMLIPTFNPDLAEACVEVVASRSGRVAELMGGDLPHQLVEDAEQSGVELLPYGSELETECSCAAWLQPCPHAIALLQQLAWLVEADPFVLLHLRGLPREELLARVHGLRPVASPDPESEVDVDLDVAYDAALRARRMLLRELDEQ